MSGFCSVCRCPFLLCHSNFDISTHLLSCGLGERDVENLAWGMEISVGWGAPVQKIVFVSESYGGVYCALGLEEGVPRASYAPFPSFSFSLQVYTYCPDYRLVRKRVDHCHAVDSSLILRVLPSSSLSSIFYQLLSAR